jgi:CRP-like cAMP-binding protein
VIHSVPEADPTHHDLAHGGSPLSNLTFSIGRLMFKCKVEIGRPESLNSDDEGYGPAVAGTPPMFSGELRDRLRRTRWLNTADRILSPRTNPQSRRQRLPNNRRHLEGLPVSRFAPVNFWESLDPTEREALRSVASWRAFAAGAMLMQEGERADHVIVILGGRTKICVSKNGRERILAERGVGQLVGERGALQISVRSASVIALEMVWALVVQTKDFAAFISAHPRVLAIVQEQCDDRRTEEPTGYGYDIEGAGSVSVRSSSTTATDPPARRRPAEHSPKRLQPLTGENCTVFLTDVVAFGARTRNDQDRRIIREALFSMTHAVLQGIPDVWSWDDRGDGLLTVIPPSVPTARVIEHLHRELPAALDEHNRAYHDSARIKLRVAINVGPVASDSMGVSGEAIIVTARLVESQLFKKAIDTSGVSLGVIASTFIYENVIRHHRDLAGYSQVQVDVKESSTAAWMKLFGGTVSPPGD